MGIKLKDLYPEAVDISEPSVDSTPLAELVRKVQTKAKEKRQINQGVKNLLTSGLNN